MLLELSVPTVRIEGSTVAEFWITPVPLRLANV